MADNLGLRGPFEETTARGGARSRIENDLKLQQVRKVVIIVVNAASKKNRGCTTSFWRGCHLACAAPFPNGLKLLKQDALSPTGLPDKISRVLHRIPLGQRTCQG